jgi:S-formylglutathione hydrolase FrmB
MSASAVSWLAANGGFGATSMLDGWLPLTMESGAAVLLALAIGMRSRRWWVRWMPIVIAAAIITILLVRWYVASEGLAGDPAPLLFWVWCGLTAAAVAVAALGWRSARWWRRIVSLVSIPMCLLSVVLLLNIWVGYARTTQSAWNFISGGSPPNEADLSTVKAMAGNGTVPHKGRIVPVAISSERSGFRHRGELVYLPPAWFTSVPPPQLPVVMMIGGEFGTSADWLWAGGAQETADEFAAAHGGIAPVLVFVDKGGAFNKDTECVNGSRGNAADHLVKDVVPYVISTFGVSADASNWGIVGWSMGGTCAVDLTVMHPDLFSTFVDIDGDIGPSAGTVEQTIDRLFDGDQEAWASFDPTTVMTRHGDYTGVTGVFGVEGQLASDSPDSHTAAAYALAKTASDNGIACSMLEVSGKHDWSVGAAAFGQTLPWLASALRTPGLGPVPLPGTPMPPTDRDIGRGLGWPVHASVSGG